MNIHTAKEASGAAGTDPAAGVASACRRLIAASPDATLRDLAEACAGTPEVFHSYPQTVLASVGAAAPVIQVAHE
jgi:hypothetical protein